MRHRMSGRKFGRHSSQRAALLINLASSLVKSGSLRTTLPKAKDLRPFVEKIITMSLKNKLSSRRHLLGIFRHHHETVSKLIEHWGPCFEQRPGGYTRIIKDNFRQGDSAPMAIIQFVEQSKPSIS